MPLNSQQEAVRYALASYLSSLGGENIFRWGLTAEDFNIIFNSELPLGGLHSLTMPAVSVRIEPSKMLLDGKQEFQESVEEAIRKALEDVEMQIDSRLSRNKLSDAESLINAFTNRLKKVRRPSFSRIPVPLIGNEGAGYPEIGADSWLELVRVLNRYALPKSYQIETVLFQDRSPAR